MPARRGDRRPQALFGQNRRSDPAGEGTNLGERILRLLQRLVEQGTRLDRVVVQPALGGGRSMPSRTSRCCGPSCRSRSSRRKCVPQPRPQRYGSESGR